MVNTQHVCLDEVVGYLDDLEDPRSDLNQRHPLVNVVVIALMAVLTGAGGPNQETLHQEVINYIDEQAQNDFADVRARRHITQETGRGREEIRSYIQMPVPDDLRGLELWKGLKSIGMATLVCACWERNGRGALLHQQFGREREVVRPRRSESLGQRERLPFIAPRMW